ncbi:MAG: tail fiber protein, partial [Polaribacter sp.]
MKNFYYTFILFLLTTVTLAQGIAVQGIARDNDNNALTSKEMQFTFEIIKADKSVVYSETQSIRTDSFGVFSHIVSTGAADTSGDKVAFNEIDFSLQNMRIRVFVNLPPLTEVYDQPFQYTPYAHYAKNADNAKNAVVAANGVPTGSIMPFMGTTAPAGWLMCDGSEIPSQHTTLRAMFSNNRTPNLRGRFLKGAGTGGGHNAIRTDQFDETTLGA